MTQPSWAKNIRRRRGLPPPTRKDSWVSYTLPDGTVVYPDQDCLCCRRTTCECSLEFYPKEKQ